MRFLPRVSRAFTVIEMLVVMAVIAILAGIVLSLSGYVQRIGATARAKTEINTLSSSLEKYKADFGAFPASTETAAAPPFTGATNVLDPRLHGDPNTVTYHAANLVLYRALSGDMNGDGVLEVADASYNIEGQPVTPPAHPGKPVNYCPEIFTPSRLSVSAGNRVQFFKDPFGNSYGYSTKGAAIAATYQAELVKNGGATPPAGPTSVGGYNTTFDLWSTCGKTTLDTTAIGTTRDDTNTWAKNW
jgi:prepilin-type N-terminal cleavage/methylation domain-containing protein